jgi:acetamidase/formamidase
VTLHVIPLERRTLHGHFARDLEPVVTVDPGDSIRTSTLDAGWGLEPARPGSTERRRFEPRDPELDAGHPLIGPVEVRGAEPGDVLEVRIDEVLVGSYGFTDAGGWPSELNERFGVSSGETHVLSWQLDRESLLGRDQSGREVALAPFPGVLGMPLDEPGIHSTSPPRRTGGNIDCRELVAGTTLLLPIAVSGALFSAGDGHAAQGDGELSGLAIECPLDSLQLTLSLRDDLRLEAPVALTAEAWLTFGFDERLDEAMGSAAAAMLDLIERELGVSRRDALALASLVVDLRITQVVNGVRGVHAMLAYDALARLR